MMSSALALGQNLALDVCAHSQQNGDARRLAHYRSPKARALLITAHIVILYSLKYYLKYRKKVY